MIGTVYFDTSALDGRSGIPLTWDDLIVRARQEGRIQVPLSISVIEETLNALDSSDHIIVPQVQRILRWTDWRYILKPTDLLLSADIASYAAHGRAESPFFERELANVLVRSISDLRNADLGKIGADYGDTVKVARSQVAKFRSGMQLARVETAPLVGELLRDYPNFSFETYHSIQAPRVAADFAKRVGVFEACHQRGIEGLLHVPSVQMSVGLSLSLVYAQAFEGTTPKPGDSRDLQHATMAAAGADVFVTNDAKLRTLLNRLPRLPLKVLDTQTFTRLLAEVS